MRKDTNITTQKKYLIKIPIFVTYYFLWPLLKNKLLYRKKI